MKAIGFEIRAATVEDVPAIASIHVECWRAAYRGILPDDLLDGLDVKERELLWHSWLTGERVETLVATQDGCVTGFARVSPPRPFASPPPDCLEITHVYIDPHSQKRGSGRAIFARVIESALKLGCVTIILWVLEENHRARAFYEAFGFHADGAKHMDPNFLGNDAVEVRYRRRAKGQAR